MLICFCLGLKFPHEIYGHAMVSTQSSLYVIGGQIRVSDDFGGQEELSDSIFELTLDPNYTSEVMWIQLPQKLKVPRRFVAAIMLPEELATCQQVSTTAASTIPSTTASTKSTTSVSPTPKGTLMVVGGAVDFDYHTYQFADIIDLDNEASECQSLEYPLQAFNIQAGLVLDSSIVQPIFCGGIDETNDHFFQNCYKYLDVSQEFAITTNLSSEAGIAQSASAVQKYRHSDEQFLWITGGVEDSGSSQKSVQIVSVNGNVQEGPEMLESMSRHCAVAISDKAVLVVGGYVSQMGYSNKTQIYDFENSTWNPGPELNMGREYHACATFEMDEKFTVYVVGGYNEGVINSVEFAVFDLFVQSWNEGMLE